MPFDRVTYILSFLVIAFLGVSVFPSFAGIAGQDGDYPVRLALPRQGAAASFAGKADIRGPSAEEAGARAGEDAPLPAPTTAPTPAPIPTDAPAPAGQGGEGALGLNPNFQSEGTAAQSPAAAPKTALDTAPDRQRPFGVVFPVDYDIGLDNASQLTDIDALAVHSTKTLPGTIKVRKPIRFGAAAPSKIDVKIGPGASVYLNSSQLASLFEGQGRPLKMSAPLDANGFVSLVALRDMGLNIRYDASRDSLVIDGES